MQNKTNSRGSWAPYAPDAARLTKSLLPRAVVAGFLRMPPLPNINLILSSPLSASEIPLAALNMYGEGGGGT